MGLQEPGDKPLAVGRAALSALCACLVGIGLARFGYTPLIPALIGAHWFSPSEAAFLGAANLAGYLLGALVAGHVGSKRVVAVLRAMMIVTALSFLASAYPFPFAWFFFWRFAAGVAGGALMVLAALTVLPHVSPGRRGRIGGIIFTGVGLGIVGSGTLVPLLMRVGLSETWISFGVLALGLTALGWSGWPRKPVPLAKRAVAPRRHFGSAFTLLCVEYALNAVGLVPHMVFFVDYIARGLGHGLDIGGIYWTIFGLGAAAGPILTGALADRAGFRRMWRIALLVQALAVALILLSHRPVALVISSAVVGLFVTGIGPVVLGRMHELVHDPAQRQAAWSWCTTAFALGQAGAAYGYSVVFSYTGGAYVLMFASAAIALLIAFVIDLMTRADLRPDAYGTSASP